MATVGHQQPLLMDAGPTRATRLRRVRLGETTVFEIEHQADRLENVVVVRDPEGRLAAALNEQITPGGRAVVVVRPGDVFATVRPVQEAGYPRRWAVTVGTGSPITVAGDLTKCPSRLVAEGHLIAETTVDPGVGSYRLVVPRPQDTTLVLGTVLAIEHLVRYE
jgi:hypothetical protein